MKAKEYKQEIVNLLARGYTLEEAIHRVANMYIEELRECSRYTNNGNLVLNKIKELTDKWKAMARMCPDYAIKEDGFMIILQISSPGLYATVIEYKRLVQYVQRTKKNMKDPYEGMP